MPNVVHDYEMSQYFEVVPAASNTNGQAQYRAVNLDTDTMYVFTNQPDGTIEVQATDKEGVPSGAPQTIGTPIVADTDTDTITSAFNLVGNDLVLSRTDIDGNALADLTVTLPAGTVDTNTIQTGATYDPLTGILTQTFTDKDGVALPDITTSIPQLDVCATPTRVPDVATMEIIYCDANGLGKMSYRDFLNIDSDGDGLPDVCEVCLKTDPDLVDTDGGGVNDGDEVTNGTDPLVAIDDDCGTAGRIEFTDVGSGNTYYLSDTASTGLPVTDVGGNIIGYQWSNCPDTVTITDTGSGATLVVKE